jgi:hypothetical protein
LDGTNYVPGIEKQTARLRNNQGEARQCGSDYRHGHIKDDAYDRSYANRHVNSYDHRSAGRFLPQNIRIL